MEKTDWHRLFGLVLADFFTGSPYKVEIEKDLSIKQQRLDVVVVRKEDGEFQGKLPDGMEDLVDHNLISFKSYQEALNAWAMKELIGHYVNYRKQESDDPDNLLPEECIRLFGVCARYPEQLASQVPLENLRPGVFDCRWGTDRIRLIVVRDLQEKEQNAMLQLFSAVPRQVEYAQSHYRQHSRSTSKLIHRLLSSYYLEGIPMSYTLEDFERDTMREAIERMSIEQRLQGLSAEEIIERLPKERREEILEKLPIEERLKGMSKEEIEDYLKRMDGNKSEDT